MTQQQQQQRQQPWESHFFVLLVVLSTKSERERKISLNVELAQVEANELAIIIMAAAWLIIIFIEEEEKVDSNHFKQCSLLFAYSCCVRWEKGREREKSCRLPEACTFFPLPSICVCPSKCNRCLCALAFPPTISHSRRCSFMWVCVFLSVFGAKYMWMCAFVIYFCFFFLSAPGKNKKVSLSHSSAKLFFISKISCLFIQRELYFRLIIF